MFTGKFLIFFLKKGLTHHPVLHALFKIARITTDSVISSCLSTLPPPTKKTAECV